MGWESHCSSLVGPVGEEGRAAGMGEVSLKGRRAQFANSGRGSTYVAGAV